MAEHEPCALADARERCRVLGERPLMSIVTPVFETPELILRACLDSVLAQDYEQWELCLVNDGSASPHVREILDAYSHRDPRVKVHHLHKNQGIAQATNEAIKMAHGDFVGFLDHDDALAPHALCQVALAIAERRETDLLYSDEDRIDMKGYRVLPFFKPEWSPDLFRACNYICHFLVVRRSLGQSLGWLRPGFDGAQDFDLALRLVEKTDRIVRIPEVLYHWRSAPESTALDIASKPKASKAGIAALQEHLARVGERAEVSSPAPTVYRLRHPVPPRTRVSLIIAVRAAGAPVQRLVAQSRGLRDSLVTDVILVGIAEATRTRASRRGPHIRMLGWGDAFHPAAMWNEGARHSTAEVLIFLHDDVELPDPESILELAGQARRANIGAVGPKVFYPDGLLAAAGFVLPPNGNLLPLFAHQEDAWSWTSFGSTEWTRNYSTVAGPCLAVARERFVAFGGFTSSEDPFVDFGLRTTKSGLRCVYTPYARIVHRALCGQDGFKFGRTEEGPSGPRGPDPFWNPNLSFAAAGRSRK
jgi:glycosyltransferase involved in cell wall biosynthesis